MAAGEISRVFFFFTYCNILRFFPVIEWQISWIFITKPIEFFPTIEGRISRSIDKFREMFLCPNDEFRVFSTTKWWNLQLFAPRRIINFRDIFLADRRNSRFRPATDWQNLHFFPRVWLKRFAIFTDDLLTNFDNFNDDWQIFRYFPTNFAIFI